MLSELSEESDSEVAEVVEPADRPRRQLFTGAETRFELVVVTDS